MAVRASKAPKIEVGSQSPRIAPPRPVRSAVAEYRQQAADIGIDLMPWQVNAATYMEAVGPDGRWLFPEVAVIVARQNGKTELLVPHIVRRLRMGRKVMHSAQNRELPREIHDRVSTVLLDQYRDELRRKPRYGSGQESIEMKNGGRYRIAAATRGGARGPSNDDLIVDELREMTELDFMAAAEPTLAQSANPQILFLSNAGDDLSIVLNALRKRADVDPNLAYLEWSAGVDRDVQDRAGWLEANPAVGQLEGRDMMRYLERKFDAYRLTGELAIFETEHLCRSVASMRERLVDDYAFAACRKPLADPRVPSVAVSMTPDGQKAAAVMAWLRPDRSVSIRVLADVYGDPIDTAQLGADLLKECRKWGAKKIGYDPQTDAELAKHFVKPTKVSGTVYQNASAQFVNLVAAGRLNHQDDGTIAESLTWAARRELEAGRFEAVRMSDDHPIPVVLAAIRAVWLASGPDVPSARMY